MGNLPWEVRNSDRMDSPEAPAAMGRRTDQRTQGFRWLDHRY
jgi:hypothetical protein